MKLRPEQLNGSLKKSLLPIYLISGDETLLVQEAVDAIRQSARENGYDERHVFDVDRQFDWNSLLEDANALSLFSDKKLTELKLGKFKPGTPGSKALQHYCELNPDDNILVIANKLDSAALKSKWAQAIDKLGAIVQVWPVSLEEMPRWLAQRARQMQLQLDKDALDLLTDRLEGNLLAAHQELEKLRLLYGRETIDLKAVEASVGDSARYDIFDLTDACIAGKAKQAVKISAHLKMEGLEPSIVLWALSKEIRTLYALAQAQQQNIPPQSIFKQFRIFPKRQQPLLNASRRHSIKTLSNLLDQSKQVDDLIKGVSKDAPPWDKLDGIAMGICSVQGFN